MTANYIAAITYLMSMSIITMSFPGMAPTIKYIEPESETIKINNQSERRKEKLTNTTGPSCLAL